MTFLDADDFFEPMALDRMLTYMLAHSANACVAGTRYLLAGIPISSGVECWHKLDKAHTPTHVITFCILNIV